MRTARVTFLTTPDEKADLETKAANLGVSSSEFVRLAVDNFDKPTAAEEAELAALVEEVNKAIPKMKASLERMSRTMRETSKEVDRSLRAAGIRK
jgi:hypothetical protein